MGGGRYWQAVKAVVTAYDDDFNSHDAHAIGALFADEGDFTNMRGSSKHGRKDIEQNYGNLLNGVLKTAHRTDTVKNVKFITPDVAEMDADWEMTGTKAADGSDNPSAQRRPRLGRAKNKRQMADRGLPRIRISKVAFKWRGLQPAGFSPC